jgi:hypothetical protein
MAATLKLTHKAIGVEVRRGTYDIVVDSQRAGSLEMNDMIEIPIEPGRHTLQVRNGRNSSRTQTFHAAEGETVAFRATGKSFCRSSSRPSSSPAWRSSSGVQMIGLCDDMVAGRDQCRPQLPATPIGARPT